jgi:hypothetical protein
LDELTHEPEGRMTGKEKRSVKFDLTHDELFKAGQDLARLNSDILNKENDKKTAVAQFDSELKRMKGEIEAIARTVQNGYEYRTIDCILYYDDKNDKVFVVNPNTGEVYATRDAMESDRQYDIFDEIMRKKVEKLMASSK